MISSDPTVTQHKSIAIKRDTVEMKDQAAKKVERFMRKAVAAVLLSNKIGENFEAIVTGASDKGTYVRILTPPAEGRLMHGEKGLSVGQKVRVRLIGMNPYKGQIDFEKG